MILLQEERKQAVRKDREREKDKKRIERKRGGGRVRENVYILVVSLGLIFYTIFSNV